MYTPGKSVFHYQLISTHDTFWIPYLKRQNIGNGKLMDGAFNYKDDMFELKDLPRHFDSDRFCGPGKYDAGILPLAFSYNLKAKDLGVLFFNPVLKYSNSLNDGDNWATIYTHNPYLKAKTLEHSQ